MLTIRLTRVGKKNSPAYRVVIADKRRAVKGKFIEIVGNYNPTTKPKTIVINKDRALFWIDRGAQPSDTVRNLMCDLSILDKKEKMQKVFGKKFTKKAIKEGADKAPEPAKEAPVTADEVQEPEKENEVPAEETVEEADQPATEESPEVTEEEKTE